MGNKGILSFIYRESKRDLNWWRLGARDKHPLEFSGVRELYRAAVCIGNASVRASQPPVSIQGMTFSTALLSCIQAGMCIYSTHPNMYAYTRTQSARRVHIRVWIKRGNLLNRFYSPISNDLVYTASSINMKCEFAYFTSSQGGIMHNI